MASGRGFSVDGIALTNGFQPLWMWALVPVAWLTSGDSTALLAAVQIAAVAIFCAAAALLTTGLRSVFGLVPALFGAGLLLVPPFMAVQVCGMESGLAMLLLVLWVTELWRGGALDRPDPALRDLRAGTWLGLLLLARLDAVFLALALGIQVAASGLAWGPGSSPERVGRTLRKGLALFGPSVLLLAPYLAWNVVRFGHLVPISGALKTDHSAPGWMPENLTLPYRALLLLVVVGASAALLRGSPRRLARILPALAAGMVAQALHSLVFMHWAVFGWHFALWVPVGAIALALLAARAQAAVPTAVTRSALAAVALFLVAAQGRAISRLHLGFTDATGEAGVWAAGSIPAGAVLAMKDSGAFTYYSGHDVVNLDGVVNGFAFEETLCRGELRQYLESHRVAYVVQHAVPGLSDGAYEVVMTYPCHFPNGRDSELTFRSDQEVYRGRPYLDHLQQEHRLVVWRLAPDGSGP